jgi:hypothetical protein
MWGVLRFAIACLLAFALPLQGVTAATMMVCGTAQRSSEGEHAHRHHINAPAPEVHSHFTSDVHEHASHMHASGNASNDKPSSSKVSHKCSVCASCCVGAAVAADPLSFVPVKLTDRFPSLAPRSVAAFVTEGLERPPRLLLA